MPSSFFSRFMCQTVALMLTSTVSLMSQQPQSKPGRIHTNASAALMQINNAMEGLAAKVSPAVVQILVTGYGPLGEENRTQTALIVRQHARRFRRHCRFHRLYHDQRPRCRRSATHPRRSAPGLLTMAAPWPPAGAAYSMPAS